MSPTCIGANEALIRKEETMGYILGFWGPDLINFLPVITAVVCMVICKAIKMQIVTGYPSGFT